MFRWLHWHLGLYTVILAHVAFSIAYVVIVIAARLRTLSPSLEEAAMDLGANEWRAFFYVMLPALVPGIIAAALLSLTVSFDDYVITSMVAGVDSETLPMVIYAMARRGASPVINAISALVTIFFGIPHPHLRTGARSMNRRYFILGMAALAGCGRDPRPRLNVYNWSAYVAPDTISNFEDEFHVRVRYATYESNEEMLAKVLTGNSGWDVVFPTHTRLQPMREYDLLQPLQHDLLPNLGNLDPRFRKPVWDGDLQWSLPYMWSGTGIAYSRDLRPPVLGWSDLWDTRVKGRLTMLDDPEDMLGACLKKIETVFQRHRSRRTQTGRAGGHSAETASAGISECRGPRPIGVRGCAGGPTLVYDSAAGHRCAPQLAFAYPQEGFPLYCDCAVILRESERTQFGPSISGLFAAA